MFRFISRADWGAQYGRGRVTDGAKTRFVVHHDGVDRLKPASSLDDEIRLWRKFEEFHASGLTAAEPRIAFIWGVMPFSGRIFEGTGWGHIGAHTAGLNSSAYGVCIPTDGAKVIPSRACIDSVTALRAEGVRLGHLSPRHAVSGHQDHGKPSCPGPLIYAALVTAAPRVVPASLGELLAGHPTLRKGNGGAGSSDNERHEVAEVQRRLVRRGLMEARHVTASSATSPRRRCAACSAMPASQTTASSARGPGRCSRGEVAPVSATRPCRSPRSARPCSSRCAPRCRASSPWRAARSSSWRLPASGGWSSSAWPSSPRAAAAAGSPRSR